MARRSTEEAREYARQWRAKNPEKYRAYNKKYREANVDRYKSLIAAWWSENPGKDREYHLRRTYGLEISDYEKLLDAQGNKCGICKSEEPGTKKGWQIDADHSVKPAKVRGILCIGCNTSLGRFHHDPDIMRFAAQWVENGGFENVARIIARK